MSSRIFGNGTDIVHWQPNPQTRGTFDILSSCMITMLLCVWTAVHLNVPIPGTVWGPRLRKVGWLVLALLAPEMVAYTAWYQRQEALWTAQVVNQAYGLPAPLSRGQKIASAIREAYVKLKRVIPSKQGPIRQPTLEAQKPALPGDRHTWTMVHGFYAVMGGIAFEISESESETFLPFKNKETWFIGGNGIRKLASLDYGRKVIPNLGEEEIKSKSKANGLAKALVCIQALWFIAQSLTRLAQRIPISLLELNTFGHAVCALLIYLLWWEKPFEVDYPTMTKGQILLDSRAYEQMYLPSSHVVEKYKGAFRDQSNGDVFEEFLKFIICENQLVNKRRRAPEEEDSEQASSSYETQSEQRTRYDEDRKMVMTALRPGEVLQGTNFQLSLEPEAWRDPTFLATFGVKTNPQFPAIELTSSDVTRWKMASRYIERLVVGPNMNIIQRRCQDWPNKDQMFQLPIAVGFSVTALIYGGLHALAWFAHFDSFTEQLLWRMSACVVMGGVPICYIFNSLVWYCGQQRCERSRSMGIYPKRENFWFKVADKGVFFLEKVCDILQYLILLAYILARAYLVVESFINLSHLPAGAYDVPRWSAYFPSIS
ncbi:hypothetical protein BDR22DRAFT_194100 [Usnea florida]